MHKPESDAEIIYFSLFKRKIPVLIQQRFNTISKEIEGYYPPSEVKDYYSLVQQVNDLEALELAARHLKKIPVLTVKFRAMVYLAETVPDNYADFINDRDRRFSGYMLLSAAVVRSCFKLIKGLIILWLRRI